MPSTTTTTTSNKNKNKNKNNNNSNSQNKCNKKTNNNNNSNDSCNKEKEAQQQEQQKQQVVKVTFVQEDQDQQVAKSQSVVLQQLCEEVHQEEQDQKAEHQEEQGQEQEYEQEEQEEEQEESVNDNNKTDSNVKRYLEYEDMPHLPVPLLRGIFAHGFERPSEIQQLATVPIAKGGDVIAQASAGSGKTGAFAVGVLARIDSNAFNKLGGAATSASASATGSASRAPVRRAVLPPQALILEPTRELAEQTFENVASIGQYVFPAEQQNAVALFSSSSKPAQDVDVLATGVSVAVGTPGRVLQLLEKGALRRERLKTLVLDEADELLSQGFMEQLQKIFRFCPKDIQVVLVSATLPPAVLEIADCFMREESTTRILLQPDQVPVQSIRQFHVNCTADSHGQEVETKLLAVADLYERLSVAQSIIFVNSRRMAEFAANTLRKQKFAVALTHGELTREERESIMRKFKAGEARVLVTTDLVSRGIDIYSCSMVINLELPPLHVIDKYIHRIGRCGRYGRRGVAINLVGRYDLPIMQEIEKKFGVNVLELPMDFERFL